MDDEDQLSNLMNYRSETRIIKLDENTESEEEKEDVDEEKLL